MEKSKASDSNIEITGESSFIFDYIIFCIFVITIGVLTTLKLIEPTVAKMHKHVVMPVTFSDGLLNYVGTVTDYYNSLFKVKTTNTLKTYLIVLVVLVVTLLVTHYYKKINVRHITKKTNENKMGKDTYEFTCIKLNSIFKVNCYIILIMFIVLSNISPIMIRINKSEISNEIGDECQYSPISKQDLELRLGVVTEINGEKYIKISKDDINAGLKVNEYDYTVEDLKSSGKFSVINVLNELYYKVYEDDISFGFSNIKQ